VVRLDQQRLELVAAPLVAAGRERAERIAVIALAARDDVARCGSPFLDEILPRHLQRGLDRLRAAADEIRMADPGGRIRTSRSASASAMSVVKKLVCA
jgi:hypothetical protein